MVGILLIRALLFEVDSRALDFWKLPHRDLGSCQGSLGLPFKWLGFPFELIQGRLKVDMIGKELFEPRPSLPQ